MQELLGLDKQLRSIRGSLKVEVAKKVQLEECIEKEKCKLEEIRDNPEYDDGIREDIRCRIAKLNDDLPIRQESIDLLKGRLTNQITSFKETIPGALRHGLQNSLKYLICIFENQIIPCFTIFQIMYLFKIL